MKKAAIATISKHYLLTNYGSFFQHYALREVLKGCGFQPFRVVDEDEGRPLLQRIIDCVSNLIKNWLRPRYWLLARRPDRDMLVFRLKMRNRMYRIFKHDYERLIGRLNEVQVFDGVTVGVRGGDQVLDRDSDRRWLSGIKEGNPKITYAASTDWLANGGRDLWKSEMTTRLNGMTAIGVREIKGELIIRHLISSDAQVQRVADPVQLLTADDFRKIQSQRVVFKRPTLMCYFLNIRSGNDLSLEKYELLAAMLNCDLQIVGIQGAELFVPEERLLILSPIRFLRALDDAAYFLTNSYHGSVFAMMYHKRFVSIRQNCLPGTNQNERQQELMTSFGLQDFWMDSESSASEIARRLSSIIVWDVVDAEVDRFRSQSIMWLKEALGGRL